MLLTRAVFNLNIGISLIHRDWERNLERGEASSPCVLLPERAGSAT